MEKLIALLNEYGDMNRNKEMIKHQDTYIISKRFGFIKWLWDNKKIGKYPYVMGYSKTWVIQTSQREIPTHEDIIIMLLSISDNPIDDLIKLLKQ